jgi:glycosyltransferase involved in cell wall biosynthesis
MKIAVLAPTSLPARRANTVQVMKMAQALVALGHTVKLAAPRAPGDKELSPGWEELAHHYGLERSFPVFWLPAQARLRRYDFAWRGLRWARRWGAQLLYTRLPQAAALASATGFPTILEAHDLPGGRSGPFLLRQFLRGPGARRLVLISQALRTDLAGLLAYPLDPPITLVAPDGVDLARFAGLPEPEQARDQIEPKLAGAAEQVGTEFCSRCFTAGYTGHLYAGRGVHLLLEMAARLPAIFFLVVGGEPGDVDRLRSEVVSAGLLNVIPAGFVPNAELPDYQAACDALLMPYQRRVAASSGGDIARYLSPMKLFEYLASGRAILSSDLPVLREVLTPQNAILLPPEEVDAWVGALQELAEHPEHRLALGEQARQEASRHTWEARAARILEGLEPVKGSQ